MPCPSINYMEIPSLLAKIKKSPEYRKKDKTELRLPTKKEVRDAKLHVTYVYNENTKAIGIETCGKFCKDIVVARNPMIIGRDIKDNPLFNEWLIPKDKVISNYGLEAFNSLTESFKAYQKTATLRALRIDEQLIQVFGLSPFMDQDGIIHISVSFGSGNMLGHIGDFLTDQGYIISIQHMNGYEEVPMECKSSETCRFFSGSLKQASPEENPKQGINLNQVSTAVATNSPPPYLPMPQGNLSMDFGMLPIPSG